MSNDVLPPLIKTPYILNGVYEWINDCQQSPYLVVESNHPKVIVPEHLRQIAPLILNVSMNAVKGLTIDQKGVSFTARFSGEVFDVFIPELAIYSLVSKETGDGIVIRIDINLDEEPIVVEPDEHKTVQLTNSHLKLT